MIWRFGLGSLAVLSLMGCGSLPAPSAYGDFSFQKHTDPVGILTGSVSIDDPGNFFSHDFNLYFYSLDDPKATHGSVAINDHCKDEQGVEPDFTKPCGMVFAIELKPGTYALQSWDIDVGSGQNIRPLRWYGPKLTVQAGKVTYVGDIHLVYDDSIHGAGADGWRGWPHASDMHERDLPVLYKRVPDIRQAEVLSQVLDLAPPGWVCVSFASGPFNGSGLDCRDHD